MWNEFNACASTTTSCSSTIQLLTSQGLSNCKRVGKTATHYNRKWSRREEGGVGGGEIEPTAEIYSPSQPTLFAYNFTIRIVAFVNFKSN